MGMSELDAARTFLAGLDLLGERLPIESEAHSHYVAQRVTWVGLVEALETDVPPWESEPAPSVTVAWSMVLPGDSVQAPNGQWYRVDSVARMGPEVWAQLVTGPDRHAVTKRKAEEQVEVRRGPTGRAVDVFRAGGLDVEVIGK